MYKLENQYPGLEQVLAFPPPELRGNGVAWEGTRFLVMVTTSLLALHSLMGNK